MKFLFIFTLCASCVGTYDEPKKANHRRVNLEFLWLFSLSSLNFHSSSNSSVCFILYFFCRMKCVCFFSFARFRQPRMCTWLRLNFMCECVVISFLYFTIFFYCTVCFFFVSIPLSKYSRFIYRTVNSSSFVSIVSVVFFFTFSTSCSHISCFLCSLLFICNVNSGQQ